MCTRPLQEQNLSNVRFNMVSDVDEINSLASASGSDSGDVYFVPALSGLYVPRWRPDARGTICGLTQHSGREQLLRATMEAIAFQTREVITGISHNISHFLYSVRP